MPGKPHKWPPLEEIEAVVLKSKTWHDVSRTLGVPRSTVQAYCSRHGISAPQATVGQNTGVRTITAPEDVDLGRIHDLLKRDGLNPDDWLVNRLRLNEWGKCGECGHDGLEQRRVDLTPRTDFLMPVRADGWRPPRKATVSPSRGLIGLFPDQHAPYHDPMVHEAACAWIRDAKPEKIVLLGDLLDNPSVSRHRKMGHEPSLKDCMVAGYGLLRGYCQAIVDAGMTVGPDSCEVVLIGGNHDEERVRNALRDKGLSEVAELTRVEEDIPIHSLEHLMRLDELGVTMIRPPVGTPYDHAEHRVTENLLAVHGWIAKKGSGASALATLERVNENVVQGHTHRQALVFLTRWVRGELVRLTAVEAGTMALVEQSSLNYANRPDWQAGWAVGSDHGDAISFDFASKVGERVIWRDTAYV